MYGFLNGIEVLRANGGVYCVNEASGIRMDVFIARGDLFLIVSCSFVCFSCQSRAYIMICHDLS